VKEVCGNRWPVLLPALPLDRDTLLKYRDAGVDCFQPQFEVWGKDLFHWICPGKVKMVGDWDTWMRRLEDCVEVFGEGNVCPTIVAGLEMAQPHGFADDAAA